MKRSVTSVNALKGMDDVASPHERLDAGVTPVDWLNIDNIGPAGSINSSVTDMAQWVRMQLGQGTYAGKKLIEPRTVKEMHTLQMHIRPSETEEKLYPESHLSGYGLGWSLKDYRGLRLVVARRRHPRHAGLGRDDPGEEPRRGRAHQHGGVDACRSRSGCACSTST